MRKFGGMASAVVMTFCLAAPAVADVVEDGLKAAERGDHAAAKALWAPAAERGNPTAQSYLGRLYLMGWGVPKNLTMAASWYRKAADQGNTAAQNNLGTLYANGLGVPRDQQQAFVLFSKAADAGAMEAYVNVARTYEIGQGVTKNCDLALSWYGKAAKGNYPGAQAALDKSPCRK